MANLKLEIQQAPAFSSVEEEALLNLLRTSDCLNRAFQQKIAAGASPPPSTTFCGSCAAPDPADFPVPPSATA